MDSELRAEVSIRCGRILMSHVSNGMKLILAAHAAENTLRTHGVSWQQRGTVMRILANDEPKTARELSMEFDYEFEAWHVALIFWGSGDARTELAALESAARAWIEAVGGGMPLLVPVDDGSMWGWFSTTAPMAIGSEPPLPRGGVRVAVGSPGFGLAGFRDGHEEARQIRSVAERLDTDRAVFGHSDFAILALLNLDSALLARFVQRMLGGLAEPTERARRLRETVRSYLAHGENVRAAAAAMHFHRNTILGRLDLAGKLRGRPLDEDRLGLALAIEIAETLGTAVFSPVTE